MPPKKAARTESAATAAAAHKNEVAAWIEANDELLDKSAKPWTISELLDKLQKKSFVRQGATHNFDWSVFRSALENRTTDSNRWFIQLRDEDLLCEPDGLEGVSVECFVVAEASEPSLAPAHYVVKEHWPNSDLEDNAPERVLSIKDQGLIWRSVTKDDGVSINTFVLSKADVTPLFVAPLTSGTTTQSFSFGAPAATTAPIAFSFGNSVGSGVQASVPPTFGFGTSPSTQISFGFGNSTPQSQAEVKPFDAVAAAEAAKPFKPMKPNEVLFVLWSKARVKEMLKELKSGSRIVQENVTIGTDGKKLKLVMQNDLKDNVQATARELLLTKVFAKMDGEVKKVDKWLDDCPCYDENLAPHLQKFRSKFLKEAAENGDDFQKIIHLYEANIVAELEKMVAVRKVLIKAETEEVERIAELLKQDRIADKSTFKILKYYPDNTIIPFRPFGKVSGISERGEQVDFCHPPMYVFTNKFLQRAQ